MIDLVREWSSRRALLAGRQLLSAIIMPVESGQERIDPAEIDRFSSIGVGAPATLQALADAFCSMDRDDPTDHFLAGINEVLSRILSPMLPIPSIGVEALERAHGRFLSSKWSIVLDEELIENRQDSEEDLLNVLNTLAHELRHAEQFYAAAKFEASLHRISFYDFLPETVRERAVLDPSVEGDEKADFGKFILTVHTNDEIREKKRYIDDAINNPDISSADYEYYVGVVNTKLPLERDAVSIGEALYDAVEACLKPW